MHLQADVLQKLRGNWGIEDFRPAFPSGEASNVRQVGAFYDVVVWQTAVIDFIPVAIHWTHCLKWRSG